jgi:hypothetical protein
LTATCQMTMTESSVEVVSVMRTGCTRHVRHASRLPGMFAVS